MSWSREAYSCAVPVLDDIKKHPFILELASGTLSKERFARYLAQDRIYLVGYASEMNAIAEMLPKGSHADMFRQFAMDGMQAERDLHDLLSVTIAEVPEAKPLEGTVEYMKHTSEIIESKDLALSLAATLPCTWIYNEIGKYLQGIANMDSNPYSEWIKCYTSPLMDQGAKSCIELTDLEAARQTDAKRELMTAAFIKSTQFEWIFWDQAYNG